MSETQTAAAPAQDQQRQQQEQRPEQGGSYERTDGGELKRLQATEPAPDRAAPEPDEQGTARLPQESSEQPQLEAVREE